MLEVDEGVHSQIGHKFMTGLEGALRGEIQGNLRDR